MASPTREKNINNADRSINQNTDKSNVRSLTDSIAQKIQTLQVEPIAKQAPNIIPPKNLTIVRQASLSSEEGNEKKNGKRQKQKKTNQQKKALIEYDQRFLSNSKKVEAQKPQMVYDDYNVLKISGLLDAYQHFLKLLCKNGLPTGNVCEYGAQQILKYEKRKINKQLKMRAELDIQKILKKNEKASQTEKSRSVSPYYHH